jgi:iron complex outermembrane receptor protein
MGPLFPIYTVGRVDMTNTRIRRAIRLALSTGAAASTICSFNAFAQDQDQDEELGTLVVTGSRIQSPNLQSTTPVTQVTSEDVILQGVTRIEDLVNQLPQAFAAQNVTVANGATGTATLNLRGLGSPRTLVLVDGRRMPYGGVTNSAADINQIPAQMVERVDILTGGASAVYGSDAVAGVVNFIMKKDFEGAQITSQYNFYMHENGYDKGGLRQAISDRNAVNPGQFALPDDSESDGEGYEASFMLGMNTGDGRGNMTAYFTVFDSDQVLQRDRDFSACALAAAPTTTTGFLCGGSATNHIGTFTDFDSFVMTVNDANTWRDSDSLTNTASADLYNFGPLNHYQRPERRYSLGAMGHYEVAENVDVYTQLMFTDYRSDAQIAPSGAFFETSSINCDNPFLPQGSLAQMTNNVRDANGNIIGQINCDPSSPDFSPTGSITMYIGRRNVEGGGRVQSFRNQSFRGVAGVRGGMGDAWTYDVSGQFSSTRADATTNNYFVVPRVARAIDVIIDPDTGLPACRTAISGEDPACVPWNPFVPNGVTPDQLAYLQATGVQTGTLDQEVYLGTISGDLGEYGIKLPTASDGVQLVFGAEYRRDTLRNQVDAIQEQGQLGGSGGPTIGIEGATKATDLFFEGRLPIMQDRPGFESLSFDTAYRFSDYGNEVTTDTYKMGLEWAPIEDVRLRGSYQRAVRAANIVELFTAQGFNLFDMDGDPCGAIAQGGASPIADAAECAATGVPPGFFGAGSLDSPAGQYNFLQGGNPDLRPEESDTISYGVVFTPRFAEGLSLTIDYFDIQIDDTISTFQAQNTLTACYELNVQSSCDLINRNANGQIWVGTGHVIDTNINIGSLQAKGYDVNLVYRGLGIGPAGSLSFDLTGTLMDELVTEPGPGIASFDCVGFFASVCLTPTPEWRHRFRTSWMTPWDLNLALTWRFFDAVTGLSQANVPMPANRIDREFDAQSYFDLSVNWAFMESGSLVLGINNVLDEDPPLSASVGTTGNGNTYPQVYDALGRYVFIRATLDF